jgi:two-component system sensor histidine kinase DegS
VGHTIACYNTGRLQFRRDWAGSLTQQGTTTSGLRERVRRELDELTGSIVRLEVEVRGAADELVKAEVIRRHLARNPERFSPHERESIFERIQSLAMRKQSLDDQLVAARERVHLLEEVRIALDPLLGGDEAADTAVTRSRLEIARMLQDGPAQALSNLALEAEIVQRLLQRDPSLVPAELEALKVGIKSVAQDLRTLMAQLRPAVLEELGLIPAVSRMVTDFQERTGVASRFKVVGQERPLSLDVQGALQGILDEALKNTATHAQCGSVEVILEMREGRTRLKVRDDGAGFDIDSGGGPGLSRMRDLADSVGGRTEIRSQPGRGTDVYAEFDS